MWATNERDGEPQPSSWPGAFSFYFLSESLVVYTTYLVSIFVLFCADGYHMNTPGGRYQLLW
jgi:hypothetical protein